MCSELLRRLAMSNSSWVQAFNNCLQKADTWLLCQPTAYLKGKESASPCPETMRAIIPVEPLWQLVDSLLASRLQQFLDCIFAPVPGVHVGARKGTQAVEIPCALQIACEKCQDYGVPAAFGQIDSMQHYDRLDMCVIAGWLCEKGVPKELTAATIGFQSLSCLSLALAGQTICIGQRSTGALTGTRLAGQLGRIPIESTAISVHKSLYGLGLPLFMPTAAAERVKPGWAEHSWEPFMNITFATYVDNVFIAAKDSKSMCLLADAFEKELQEKWNQTIKPSSREFFVPKGAPIKSIHLGMWKFSPGFRALGVTLQNNSETDGTWNDTEKKAMRIFFKVQRSGDCRSLAARWKVRLLNIHVFPFVQYRLTSTPLSATRLYQIQKLQRRMLLGVLRVQTIPSQTPLERAKARNAIASYWIMQFPWHSKIATAQIKFNDHIQRAAWHNCWAGLMTLFCDTPVHSRWLATGRLRRFFQGHIATRWQTIIETCRVHSTDPWQILIDKSSKFKGRFDLAAHQKRESSISSTPEFDN